MYEAGQLLRGRRIHGAGLLCLALLVCAWPAARAGLTLEQAVEEASWAYPSVMARRGDVRSSEADLRGAEWQRFPSLSLAGGSDALGHPYTLARIEQPLWMWGRLDANIEAAQARLQAGRAELQATRLDVMLKTASAFAEGLRAQGRAQVAARNVAEHERLFRMIERRVQGEITSSSDATMASARLQQAMAERIQFDTQVVNAGAALSQLLGRAVRVEELQVPPPREVGFATLEQAQEAALASAPSIQRAQADEAAARAGLDARRASALPQLLARVEQQYGGAGLPRQSAYIVLQYQTGGGLSLLSTIQAGTARVDAAQASQSLARIDLLDRVRADWNDAIALRAQLVYLRDIVKSTAEVKESYLRQYTVGRKTWIEVLNAQREAAQALYAQADTEASLLLATVRLDLNTGRMRVPGTDRQD